MSLLDDWIVHYCADPAGQRAAAPRWPLAPELGDRLIEQAEAHGVLGAVLQNFAALANEPAFARSRNVARARHRANAAFSLLLRREADNLMADVREQAAAVVKGPVFARRLYPEPSLRCFTDIDILAAPEALPRIGEVLADHGYTLVESHPREFKWLHRDNDRLMVEVQTDLVHADSLHRVLSLPYQAIAAAPEAAEALLLIALVHGAAHQYERLQHVVDICQAARALKDAAEERRFEDMVIGEANMRWSVVSLESGRPQGGALASRGPVRGGRGRDVEPTPTDTASARSALDRIVIPQDALDRIAGIAPRSSLIITDEAVSSETGKGTDFVVLLSGEPQGGIKTRRRDSGAQFSYARPRDRMFDWR